MNFKSIATFKLTLGLMAGLLFMGDAVSSDTNVRRLAREISLDSAQIFRIAQNRADRFDYRENQALFDLQNLKDKAHDLEMDANNGQVRHSIGYLDQAAQAVSYSLNDLTAHNRIEDQFRSIRQSIKQLKRSLRGGDQGGRGVNVAPLARKYKRQVQAVINDIKYLVRGGGRNYRVGQERGRGGGSAIRRALESLRGLKFEAKTFLQVTRDSVRPRRVKRAFENLAAAHRNTRAEVMQVLRRTGAGASMREASRTLREIGQKLDRRPSASRQNFQVQNDFGFYPRY